MTDNAQPTTEALRSELDWLGNYIGGALPAATSAGEVIERAHRALYAVRDAIAFLDADAPAEPRTAGTLAEDIAAMLHYRGRVLHPRSHPKTHGGPCDECAEAGRQAAEFAGSPPTILIRDCEATDHYAAPEPRSAEPEGLDAAWADAEAALPDGWRVSRVSRGLAHATEWVAWAHGEWQRKDALHGNYPSVLGRGDTPAAALSALAARLRGEQRRGTVMP